MSTGGSVIDILEENKKVRLGGAELESVKKAGNEVGKVARCEAM